MANTVALCMICKNEKSNISNLLDDVCPYLEEVHIVDTGSTDGTLDLLNIKKQQYPNLNLHHFDWVDNFSAARNFSFSLAGNVDWIFWLDCDDRIDGNSLLHFKYNILDNNGVDAWLLPYIYTKNEDGIPGISLTRERFLRKKCNPKWIGAIHETVDISNMRQFDYKDLVVDHNRDGKVFEIRRNLKILEKEFLDNKTDPRTCYYYAKELFDHIDPKAKQQLIHYLALPYKYWDDEIGARFRLAQIYLSENDLRNAVLTVEPIYHLDATRKRSEYYFTFGQVEYALNNWEIAIDWFERCLKEPPGSPRVLNLEFWTWHPLKKIAECYSRMGKWDKCFEYVYRVISILKNDINMQKWAESFKSFKLLPKNGSDKIVVEFGSSIYDYSYKFGLDTFRAINSKGEESGTNFYLTSKNERCDNYISPYSDESIDGVVLQNKTNLSEFSRLIKPLGFIKTPHLLPQYDGFGYLGLCDNLHTYIKYDTSKPSIGYIIGDASFGPYRYRIHNLIKSAIRQGHRVTTSIDEGSCDIHVSLMFTRKIGKINVLEVCEKLNNYELFGVQFADVINCCSEVLADHLRSLYPDKKVINVDDHFELPESEWCEIV